MKLALDQAPPLTFVLLRLVGSLVLIAPALLAARQPLLPYRGERWSLFWVGELQVAGFLICGIIGLAILPAGRAIVLAYSMPLWAMATSVSRWWAGRRPLEPPSRVWARIRHQRRSCSPSRRPSRGPTRRRSGH